MSDALLADRYKLVRRIGEGGYGTVWLARDEQLRRDVAIKKLSVSDRSKKESQKKSDRFRHEAITMAKIDHLNVVTIYDVGTLEDEQEIFLVMELLEGRSLLEELVLKGPLDRQRALDRFVETLEGLQAAHDVGVVHKDLKPANLFLHRVDTAREQMKLIDFGIARMESLTKLTGTGRMAGSPRYLAPEYIMGESVTPAIDIYQAALILVESLTGEPCIPRGIEYFAICERHILSQLEIPESLVNSPLGPVLDRALQRHPQDRFGSAEEFAKELRSIRADELPTFDSDETVRMEVPKFDDADLPSSEATVSGMVDKLRLEEAALRPASQTRRYAGIREAAAVDDNRTTTRLDRSGAQPVPPTDSGPQPAPPAQSTPPQSGPQPVPALRIEQQKGLSQMELRLMAGGAFVLALVVVIATLVVRNAEGDPVVDRSPPPSKDTCMLQCTQWYQDREVRGACQDLCRGTRPPTDPPFPLIDEVEPQFSEETDEADEPEPEAAAPEPAAEPAVIEAAAGSEPEKPRSGKPAAKKTGWVPVEKAGETPREKVPTKFDPVPRKWAE